MTFAHQTPTAARQETRARIAHAVTEMSRRIALNTVDATLQAARETRTGKTDDLTLVRLAALSTNARHLAHHLDTIRVTGGADSAATSLRPALLRARTGHRSLSVGAIIHKFAALHDAFNTFYPTAAPSQSGDGDLCEDAMPG